jgi:hypothetical protein
MKVLRFSNNALIATAIVTIASLFVLIIIAFWQADINREALCTFRADLQARVQTSEDFLEKNPEGFPGFPAQTIKQGIDNQRQTVEALSALNC